MIKRIYYLILVGREISLDFIIFVIVYEYTTPVPKISDLPSYLLARLFERPLRDISRLIEHQTEEFGKEGMCTKFIPKSLAIEQKKLRFEIAQDNFDMVTDNENVL